MGKIKIGLAIINENECVEEIGISYIGALLKENGFSVKIISEVAEETLIHQVKDFDPYLLGFSVYDSNLNKTLEICRKIKKILPDIYISLGGRNPTQYSKRIMAENSYIDFVISKEGEYPFLELAESLYNGTSFGNIKNLTFRKDSMIISNEIRDTLPDLDQLPFALRDIIRDKKMKTANILSSRGCTQQCSFCSSPIFWRNGQNQKKPLLWRGRDIDCVLEEMKILNRDIKVKYFKFLDCSFEDPDVKLFRSFQIPQKIIESKLDISYIVQFRSDIYRKAEKNPLYLDTMIQSGLAAVFIGIEAGNEEDLKLYNKGTVLKDNYNCLKYFSEHDVLVKIGFIGFNPFSTYDRLYSNIEFLYKTGFASKFHMLRRLQLINDTSIFKTINEAGLLYYDKQKKNYQYRFENVNIWNMYRYINKYFNKYNMEKMLKLQFFIELYDEKMMLMKTYYHKRDPKICNILKSYIEMYQEIMSDLNERNMNWFTSLVGIAKINWQEDKAEQYMEQYISYDYLHHIHNKLLLHQTRLYRQLMENGCKEDAAYILE